MILICKKITFSAILPVARVKDVDILHDVIVLESQLLLPGEEIPQEIHLEALNPTHEDLFADLVQLL